MSITSFQFFALFALSLLLYYLIPRRFQWVLLLAYTAVFFGLSSEPASCAAFLVSIASAALSANMMYAAGQKSKKGLRTVSFALGMLVNIGILAYIKYNGFFLSSLNAVSALLRHPLALTAPTPAAPLGISFYTMQILAYLIDVYWEVSLPQKNFFKTALFVGYFPQLTSGPIARYHEMEPQLYAGHRFCSGNVANGAVRILWGVFKKLVIAARCSYLVDGIYADTASYQGAFLWAAAGFFMIQLYADFSGCMDIVLGVSECYGITLPENFRTPFFSRTVQEYWQRWHITLGAWLKDYVMYPLLKSAGFRAFSGWLKKHFGKRAAKRLPSYLASLCVWLLIGLWHGGKWKYILGMGLWFWFIILMEQILEPLCKKVTAALHIRTDCFSWHFFQSVRTFFFVAVGNMFFRLDSLKMTFRVLKRAVTVWNPWILFDGSLLRFGLDETQYHFLLFCILILLVVSAVEEQYGKNFRELLAAQNLVFRWGVVFLLLFTCMMFGLYGEGFDVSAFIYAGF
jgi:D-alanyl-lipoteichoic acid acyltransferase DltB (MBOAT superfamily)